MAGCKITTSITNDVCDYSLAGVVAIYIANYYSPAVVTTLPDNPPVGVINYTQDADGQITGIQLPEDEQFYRIEVAEGTGNFSDQLLAGGSGGKYRQHQLGGNIPLLTKEILKESADAISLGRFVGIVETAAGFFLLGRYGGLTAPANGMDYNSGAAAADANGWTLLLQGATIEATRKVVPGIIPALTAPVEDDEDEIVG